jgi:hypothetical protein
MLRAELRVAGGMHRSGWGQILVLLRRGGEKAPGVSFGAGATDLGHPLHLSRREARETCAHPGTSAVIRLMAST